MTDNMPELSVIMPVYGVELYIAKAIESVMKQTFSSWELIVVNDGTKDRSREIAKQYEVGDSRIKVYDKENGGLSDARNFGLKLATGKYIHFFDSDDYISPDYYSFMMTEIKKSSADFIISGYTLDKVSGDVLIEDGRPCFDGIFPRYDNSREYLDFIATYLNFAWNKIYRASFLKNNGLTFQKGLYRIEDAEFMSRVLVCNPGYRFVRHTGYHYVIRDTSTLSRVYDPKIIEHTIRLIEVYSRMADSLKISPTVADKILSDLTLNIYKLIFVNLFKYSTPDINRYREVRQILNVNQFSYHLAKYETVGIMNKMFRRLILGRQALVITGYYWLMKKSGKL